MRLRQVALVASDLEPVTEALCDVLGIEIGFRDPGIDAFGLHNAVMPVGDTFLEVVSPLRPGTTAGRLLERRGGDGGYMVIVQSGDFEADRQRVEDAGVRVVWETQLEDIGTIHLHPRDIGAAILSIDWANPPDSWRWAGPEWQARVRTDVTRSIIGVELQGTDAAALAKRWSEVLGRPARDNGNDTYVIALDSGALRFVGDCDGRGDGVSGIDLDVANREIVIERARRRGLSVQQRNSQDPSTSPATRIELAGIHIGLC